MGICYCKTQIPKGDRAITVGVSVDWGDADERETQAEKLIVFHSFACIAQWATDRAEQHDDHVVTSPAEGHEPSDPVVDETTDTIIRGGKR